MEDAIRSILAEYGHLPVAVDKIRDEDDLYQVGMTSHASVNVMLALEDEFDVEFPETSCARAPSCPLPRTGTPARRPDRLVGS